MILHVHGLEVHADVEVISCSFFWWGRAWVQLWRPLLPALVKHREYVPTPLAVTSNSPRDLPWVSLWMILPSGWRTTLQLAELEVVLVSSRNLASLLTTYLPITLNSMSRPSRPDRSRDFSMYLLKHSVSLKRRPIAKASAPGTTNPSRRKKPTPRGRSRGWGASSRSSRKSRAREERAPRSVESNVSSERT